MSCTAGRHPSRTSEDVRDLFPDFGTLEGGNPKSVESTIKALGVLNAKLWDVWGVGVGLRHVMLPHSTTTAFAAQSMSFQLPAVYQIMRERHLPHSIIVTQIERQLGSFANGGSVCTLPRSRVSAGMLCWRRSPKRTV